MFETFLILAGFAVVIAFVNSFLINAEKNREYLKEAAKNDLDNLHRRADLAMRLVSDETSRLAKGLPPLAISGSQISAINAVLPASSPFRAPAVVTPMPVVSPAPAVVAAVPVVAPAQPAQPVVAAPEAYVLEPETVVVICYGSDDRLEIGKFADIELMVATLHTAEGSIALNVQANLPEDEFCAAAEQAATYELSMIAKANAAAIPASRKVRKQRRFAA